MAAGCMFLKLLALKRAGGFFLLAGLDSGEFAELPLRALHASVRLRHVQIRG